MVVRYLIEAIILSPSKFSSLYIKFQYFAPNDPLCEEVIPLLPTNKPTILFLLFLITAPAILCRKNVYPGNTARGGRGRFVPKLELGQKKFAAKAAQFLENFLWHLVECD